MKSDKPRPAKVGRYEIVDQLGAGGMGTVYLATDPLLRRTVAIKILTVHDDELRERFAREARSAASLRHNNIVTIYDVGEDDGKPFLAMEFIDGESMAELIRRRAAADVEKRLRLMIDLCSGLGYAHRTGIIHRDIKPGNLMITSEGPLKILDFGLARITTDGTSTGLTTAGSILGTPHYMSPEQIEGRPVDQRSDIFAVGLVLYELLSYQRAYTGESAHVVLHHIITKAPRPIQELVPDIDPELVRIVDKATEKSPERRYQELASLAADLERVRERASKWSDTTTKIVERPRPPAPVTPQSTPARDARARANLDLLAQRRAKQVESHVKAATEHVAAGRYEDAVAECENAMLLDPQEPRALALLAQAHGFLDDRQVRQLLDQARARLAAGDLTEAQALVEQTLMLRADLAEAQELKKQVKEQRSERERAAERSRAAKSALERATRNLEAGAFEAASRSASEVLAYDPTNEGALDVRRRAAEAIEARRRQQALDQRAQEAVDQARLRATGGDPRAALALLQAFDPPHPLVTEAAGRARAELAALEQQEREEAERERQRAIEEQRRREDARREEERAAEARRQAEEKARRDAEEKARREAVDRKRREAEEQARREAEEKARREAEEKARREAEAKARREAEEKARREAEEKARREAEEKARRAARSDETIVLDRARETTPVAPPVAAAPPPPVSAPAARAAEPAPLVAKPPAAKLSPAVMGGIAAALLLLIGGGWYFFGNGGTTESAGGNPPATAAPDNTAKPAPPVAPPANPTPEPASGSTPPSAPAVAEAEINRIHTAFNAAMSRNNFDQAARVILDAPAAARTDKVLVADAERVVAATKQRASAALARAQKTPAAFASAEFRAAEAKRIEAVGFEQRGQLPEAAREYLSATAGFTRALTAKPPATADNTTAPPAPTTTTTKPPVESSPPITKPATPDPTPSTPLPPPPTAPSAPADTTASDTAAIKETLAQFVAGYEKLDPGAIKRVYPGAPTINFDNVRSYSLTLVDPEISISGDRATVRTVRRLRVQMRAGSPQQSNVPTEFTMRRAGNGWVVDRIK